MGGSGRKKLSEPKKPKRAPNAYTLFIKKYMLSQALQSREDAQRAMRTGARIWKTMTEEEKEEYFNTSENLRARYAHEMGEYRRHVQATKAPPPPFAAFLRDYYHSGEFESSSSSQRDFITSLGQSAALAWDNLAPEQRLQYSRDYTEQFQEHKVRQERRSNNATTDDEAEEQDVPRIQELASTSTPPVRRERSGLGLSPSPRFLSYPSPSPAPPLESHETGRGTDGESPGVAPPSQDGSNHNNNNNNASSSNRKRGRQARDSRTSRNSRSARSTRAPVSKRRR